MPPPRKLQPAGTARLTRPAADSAGTLLAWRPMQVILALAGFSILTPALQHALDPYGFGQVKGGIAVDTSGESGTIAAGQFRLDLPLKVINRTENYVVELEMWTTAWACPTAGSPQADCRRMLSTGQDFRLMLQPGSSQSLPSELTGAVPAGMGGDAVVRIERRVENIYDQRDQARAAKVDAFR